MAVVVVVVLHEALAPQLTSVRLCLATIDSLSLRGHLLWQATGSGNGVQLSGSWDTAKIDRAEGEKVEADCKLARVSGWRLNA